MTVQEEKISTCSTAKLTPTASASMLVATAWVRMAAKERLVSQASSSSSGWTASHTILPPMKASSTKATQWSIEEINSEKARPRK